MDYSSQPQYQPPAFSPQSPTPSPSPTQPPPQDYMVDAREATINLERQAYTHKALREHKSHFKEFLIIGGLVLVFIVGMSIWLKPWQWWQTSQDKKSQAHAQDLAQSLATYYNQKGNFPWNITTGNYIPAQRRPEAAFTYLPASIQPTYGQEINRDWLLDFLPSSTLSEAERNYWRNNDDMYVLKQVSSGGRVVVCFVPQSVEYREAATLACTTDSLGRRDAPYEVAGFDPCATTDGTLPERNATAQNLSCVVAGS